MEQRNTGQFDEINLYGFWKVIVKYKSLILSLFLLFVITTAVVILLLPKIYRGDAIFRVPSFDSATSNVTAKELSDFIGKIDKERKKNILPKTHDVIKKMQIVSLKESKDKVQIVFESADNKIFLQALNEFIEYINAFDLLKKNVKDEQERLFKRLGEVDALLAASSESLTTYHNLLKAGKLVPVGFNPLDLNKRITELKMDKFALEQMLRRWDGGIEVVRQLNISSEPVRPDVLMYVALSGSMSFFFAVILAFSLEYVERKKHDSNTKSQK